MLPQCMRLTLLRARARILKHRPLAVQMKRVRRPFATRPPLQIRRPLATHIKRARPTPTPQGRRPLAAQRKRVCPPPQKRRPLAAQRKRVRPTPTPQGSRPLAAQVKRDRSVASHRRGRCRSYAEQLVPLHAAAKEIKTFKAKRPNQCVCFKAGQQKRRLTEVAEQPRKAPSKMSRGSESTPFEDESQEGQLPSFRTEVRSFAATGGAPPFLPAFAGPAGCGDPAVGGEDGTVNCKTIKDIGRAMRQEEIDKYAAHNGDLS